MPSGTAEISFPRGFHCVSPTVGCVLVLRSLRFLDQWLAFGVRPCGALERQACFLAQSLIAMPQDLLVMCLGEVLLFEGKVPREGFPSDTMRTAAKWPIHRAGPLSPNRNLNLDAGAFSLICGLIFGVFRRKPPWNHQFCGAYHEYLFKRCILIFLSMPKCKCVR